MSAENCAHTVLTHSEVCSLTCVLNIPCKLMSMPDSIDMIHPIVDIEASFFTDTSTMCGSGGKYSFWFLFFLGIVKGLLRSSGEPLSICITPLLLLRSLRACSLGVVLAKGAAYLYIYSGVHHWIAAAPFTFLPIYICVFTNRSIILR